MTVRVSKPAFNIREKLSELDNPVGNHGSQLMKSADAAESFNLVRAGRKNMIHNGDQRIWQRYTSKQSAAGTSLIFAADRWMFEEGCGELVATVSRSTDTPSGEGFQYSSRINVDTVESAIGSGDFAQYMYFVEGQDIVHLEWGTRYAKPVTLSFWFKTTVSGEHYVSINSNGGADTWGTRIHSPANVWKKHVVTVDPPQSGTWESGNGRGIEIRIGICASPSVAVSAWDKWYYGGSAYNGFATANSNLILTQNNRSWLTGVQLEVGTVATPFEFRSYIEELALCQRYFWKPTGTHLHLAMWSHGIADTSGIKFQSYPWPVPMRAAPSLSYYDAASSGNSGKVHIEHPDKTDHTNITVSFQQTTDGTDGGFKYPYGVSGFSEGQTGDLIAYNFEASAEFV